MCASSDAKAKVRVHENIRTDPAKFFKLVFPYMDDLIVGVECVFCWYWLADLCAEHHIRFVLGHSLYMKAIHGGKTKNDRIDSYKIASLLKGGNFPIAYAYPAQWQATRDLLRRRMYLSRRCGELVVHIVNTNTQYNLPTFRKKLLRKYNKGKALGIFTHKLGRAIYGMMDKTVLNGLFSGRGFLRSAARAMRLYCLRDTFT